jgi:hypothetical protein
MAITDVSTISVMVDIQVVAAASSGRNRGVNQKINTPPYPLL